VNAETLAPIFGADEHPASRLAIEERNELFRIRAATLLKDRAWVRSAPADVLEWATTWASVKPLGRALSDGSPALACAFSEGACLIS
jgi:hypothetical protein